MINDKNTSFIQLKKFFEDNLAELDLPDLIDIETDIKGNSTSSLNLKPLIIDNSKIETINLPNLGNQPFKLSGENLKNINIPQITVIYDNPNSFSSAYFIGGLSGTNDYYLNFLRGTKIQKLAMPNFLGSPANLISSSQTSLAASSISNFSFFGNYWLQEITFGNELATNINAFNGYWFYNNYSIRALHLCYPSLIQLIGVAGLESTPLYRGNGIIYVPDKLVDQYQAADGWTNFRANIKGESSYSADAALYNDSIKATWEEIVNNPGAYEIGQTKTFETNGIPIQMKIIGKDVDKDAGGSSVATTWAPTTISYFEPVALSTSYNSSGERSYNTETSVKSLLATIYEGMDDVLKNNIKAVSKKCYGSTPGSSNISLTYNGKIWPFSSAEFRKTSITGTDVQYNQNVFTPEYKLGATNFTKYNGSNIAIPLRDVHNTLGDLEMLVWDDNGTVMNVVQNSANSNRLVFPIFGFCI